MIRLGWKVTPGLLGLTLALLVPALAATQEARTLTYGEPGEVGMSAAILEGAVGMYKEAVDRGEIIGAVILVAREGRVVVHQAIGYRDKEQGLPMERGTLFRMASNTKPVVATGIATLVEEERLDYDVLVRELLPGWDNYRSGFVTVGQLLSHSSGLRIPTLFLRPLISPSPEHPDGSTLQAESSRFGEVGAAVPPGTSYSYSNPGYNTLGALVEVASGQLLEAYLTSTIYDRLGMEDSYNHRADHDVDGKLDRMGAVYYRRGADNEWVPGGTPGGPVAYPFARASGGMISTTWDYAIFCQMFLNGGVYGGARILDEETVELMTTPKVHISGQGEGAAYYGYGWRVRDGIFSHGGSDGTDAWVDPERGIIGLVFTQTPSGRPSVDRFRQLVNLAVIGR